MKILIVMVYLCLSGCGAGVNQVVASLDAFPLNAAYVNFIKNGQSTTFNVTAALCRGTASLAIPPAKPAIFGTIPGFSSTQTVTVSPTNCTSNQVVFQNTFDYDAQYKFIGAVVNKIYGVMQTPFSLPEYVRVGDSGLLGSVNLYTDVSKAVSLGTVMISYKIAADTASSALIIITMRQLDKAGIEVITEVDTLVIDGVGQITHKTIEIVASSGLRVLMTKI